MVNVDESEILRVPPVAAIIDTYFAALSGVGFKGDIASDIATRITFATDNSIYQIPPQGVVFPRDGGDLALIMRVANQPGFCRLTFYPRGGGTGCNGQSLGDGIVVDTSRHMRSILDFDPQRMRVKVEPGVIRDQLIAFLKPHGLFFPPHVSTSSRATIGGMVSNDSSGKGSLIYGKTSAHVEAIEVVLPDGRTFEFGPHNKAAAQGISDAVFDLISPHRREIRDVFPDLTRGFTGYDLLHAVDDAGAVSLSALMCGSEGTLALIKSITLCVAKIPARTAVVAVRYRSLDAGLRAVPDLLKARPSAIEFIDDKILTMAEQSEFWEKAGPVLGGQEGEQPARAMHFVEFEGETEEALQSQVAGLERLLTEAGNQKGAPLGWRVAFEQSQIQTIWDMRRACQGLLLAKQTRRRAQPFIEDFVVPPEYLADFIADLNEMLATRGVDVGVFGHADVGVVHMRPLLDMTRAEDRRLIREVSDKVYELTRQYGGLIWGEHGKGFRGEYSAELLGPNLTRIMEKIKELFDPDNRLNPGKIAVPFGHDGCISALDAVPMRGEYDRSISPELSREYPKALHCNGNGNCFSLDVSSAICPSYKATGDRRYSPKGRSSLIREWLRLRAIGDQDGLAEFSPELFGALDNCLSCKACASAACPARIDIPEMKAKFYQWYYRRNRRPLRDILVRNLEDLLPLLSFMAPLVNRVLSVTPVKVIIRKGIGIVDLPVLSGRAFQKELKNLGIAQLSADEIAAMPAASHNNMVVIVQDGFTSYYDGRAALAQVAMIKKLNPNVVVLKYRAGGKPLHVNGHLAKFQALSNRNARDFSLLARHGVAMVGMDAAMTLMYRHEYREANHAHDPYTVQLFSEWLSRVDLPLMKNNEAYQLIQHCTEKSLNPETTAQWAAIFGTAGLNLEIIDAGCCGMAGLFGHETAHQEVSNTLYNQTWREPVEQAGQGVFMATGYSCRSQVKRFSQKRALHPAEVLLGVLATAVDGAQGANAQ